MFNIITSEFADIEVIKKEKTEFDSKCEISELLIKYNF